ncbi:Hypothetical protein SRAE_1000197200 [Strongyloides ratti]|uniref:Uncharacterized protein n=1 Tax=Strongyloides ratti TaxID=34506 RepID=A0A090MWG6_STRRB|nr:Hypothetical protein SRAE_1000197200 [Strongyloides ratti]CEF63714.1 Hypothetical protein SRAE_1000197200 [Strongyloides ratti]
MPTPEITGDQILEKDGSSLNFSEVSSVDNNVTTSQNTSHNLIDNLPPPTTTTTKTTEGTKTIHFLKPSDILSAAGPRTIFNIPSTGKNSTHEITIIADDGNATVIKGYNSISIKASTTIE